MSPQHTVLLVYVLHLAVELVPFLLLVVVHEPFVDLVGFRPANPVFLLNASDLVYHFTVESLLDALQFSHVEGIQL